MSKKGLGRARLSIGVALVGLVAAAAFGVVTSSAPAGNRTPTAGMQVFPGPKDEVTYLEAVAFTATLENTQSSNFTHVQFHNPSPSTSGGFASFKYASCGDGAALSLGDTLECDIGTIRAGDTARVTIVWETPASGTSLDDPDTLDLDESCGATTTIGGDPDATTSPCMTNSGFWTFKEGTGNPGSEGPDTFVTNSTGVSLLLIPNPAKARGYTLDACSGGSSLETVAVGPGNKLSTKVCASSVPGAADFPLNPGLVIEIDESSTGTPPGLTKRVTETSFVCIPFPDIDPNDAVGSCPAIPGYFDVGYDPWSFDDPATPGVEQGTFTFTIDNTTLPKGEKIDAVYHNGVLVPSCSASPGADPCVVSIVVDNKLKITIVTVRSSEQGGWDFT